MPKRKVSSDYRVGYGKPPKTSRFKPGQSGNPKGRPKGRSNFRTICQRVLEETVTIQENGLRRTVSKAEATLIRLVNSSMNGDSKALRLVLELMQSLYKAKEEADAELQRPLEHLTDEELERIILADPEARRSLQQNEFESEDAEET